ncbi:MAG: DMT family transporter [Acidiferrobacterales bacterium]|nr:DMT family transporter [Nitrospira sp.]
MSIHSLYAITVLIWGSTWFAITLQLEVVDPIWSVAYRFALAGVVLIAFCLITRRRLRFGWRDQAFIALQGALLFSINYVLFYFAIGGVTSGLVAVIFSTIVFMNIVNGALLFRSPVRVRVVAGATLGLAGIALVFWPELSALQVSSAALTGLALSLLATWVASLGNMAAVATQRRGLPIIEVNALGMAYGAALTAAAALLLGAELRFEWTPRYVGSLVYLAVFGSIIAFGCYLRLLRTIGADRAAYTSVLYPLVALALSTLFEQYRWSAPAFAGVAMVLLGNLLVLGPMARDRYK